MTTQLTEAGQRVHKVMLETGAIHGNEMTPERKAALNNAAQILLPPGGRSAHDHDLFDTMRLALMRVTAERNGLANQLASLAPGAVGLHEDVTNLRTKMAERDALTEKAKNRDGWWGDVHSAVVDIERAETAVVAAALAPKTSAPGNDAGMRELFAQVVHDHGCKAMGVVEWSEVIKHKHYRDGYAGKRAYALADKLIAALAALSPPTGSAGDDETEVREATYWTRQQAEYLQQRDDESDEAWVARLRRHFAPAARAGDGVALADVAAERCRQIEAEGWTPEHDDTHSAGEMALAASSYAYEATRTFQQRADAIGLAPPMWPWSDEWWKPTTPRRDLVKAGALILADIERLDRAALTAAPAANGEGA